ncbi:hypothetical protein BH23ACT2_BH23ACT2_25740 [soil metagenome]
MASFEPSSSGVLLWTRTVGDGSLRWELARDAGFTDLVAGEDLVVGGADDTARRYDRPQRTAGERSHRIEVSDLPSGCDLYYRFELDGVMSPTGRTRTLPSDDRPVRLGLACCADYSAGFFSAYRALADADVDLVVHLGDYLYADAEGDLRDVDPDHDAVTRRDYGRRYAQLRRDPDLVALHQRHPMITVIDDHDLADNASRVGAKGHDTGEQGLWWDRMVAATAARAEWLPIRTEGPPGRAGRAQWRSVALGELGELILLDTRLAGRDPQADTDGPPLADPARLARSRPRRRVGRSV